MNNFRPKLLIDRRKSVLTFVAVLLCIMGAVQVSAQGLTVTGTVTDNNGALAGVNVVVRGTNVGDVTDVNGKYSLDLPDADAVLQFIYLGYTTFETTINGRAVVDVVMTEGARQIDDVVVTAFATQKRINVTGAISTISGGDIVAAPVANLTNALVGLAPGINATQFSGEPGRNETSITIRGMATYGDSTPLVVIDGVEQASEQAFAAFNSLNPNDILGISILKDASSTAVYGIRGANGVIIVTTKRGIAGAPKVTISSNFGFTQANSYQYGLSSYEWASLRNEAVRSEMEGFSGQDALSRYLYSDRDLWKFQNNRDFDEQDLAAMNISEEKKEQLRNTPGLYYFSWDAWPEIFGRLGPQYQSNVSVQGGTDRVKYFASLEYFNQGSITQNFKYHGSETGSNFSRYNFRANIDINVVKNTTLSVSLSGQFGTTQGPGTGDPYNFDSRYRLIMQYIYETTPFAAQPVLEGHLIEGYNTPPGSVQDNLSKTTGSLKGNQNALSNLIKGGTSSIYNTLLNNTINLKHDMPYLVKGLYLKASVNYQDNYNRYVTKTPSIPLYMVRRGVEDPTQLEFFGGGLGSDGFGSSGRDQWNRLYLDGGIYYDGSFNNHNVGAMFVATASKYTMPWDSNNTPSGVMGLVGRVTYDYASRYMVEMNLGYNGTEQFAPGKRFGLFPAFSAGWVPSNESFFPKNKWVTFLKFRGSYGEVGNDFLGGRRYLYMPNTYNLNQGGYYLGNSTNGDGDSYYSGATEGSLGNPNVTWERAVKYDIGMELHMFNDRLSLVFDWFNEDRNNILTTLQIIPATYGVSSGSVPPANVGITTNKGYEIELGWSDAISNTFSYFIKGSMGYARNKIIYRAEAPNPYPWMNETNHSIGQRYGLRSDGFFDTIEELNNRPYNSLTNNRATLGDIKYKDLNGDGYIDEQDQAPIGYPNRAEYNYSLRMGFNVKGFDFNALFTGTANGSYYLTGFTRIPFNQTAGNAFQWQANGRWTAEKYASGAEITLPRMAWNPADGTHNNYLESDFWMFSSDHIKLKNIEIGYSFPATMKFMRFAGISSLRIYANANNVWTIFDKIPDDMGIDPETRDQNTFMYPLTRTINFGFNIQF
jgi:TonB-linked SusC/RagA family outer membrane protein